MLVIDKPAGIAVHPGPRGGPSLEDYFAPLKFGLPRNPALAHRLDQDTSGCLVLGRHPKALRKLGRLFANGSIEKTYIAECAGIPEKLSGTIDGALNKQKTKRGWRMIIDPEGKPARTTYRVIARAPGHCLIAAQPKTGRTHQIRVHLASIGSPITGDDRYGAPPVDNTKLKLHAQKIVIPLYPSRDAIIVRADIPESFAPWREAIADANL